MALYHKASAVIWQRSGDSFRGATLDDSDVPPDVTGETLISHYNSADKVNALFDRIFDEPESFLLDNLGEYPGLCSGREAPEARRWQNVKTLDAALSLSRSAGVFRWYIWDNNQWTSASPDGSSPLI